MSRNHWIILCLAYIIGLLSTGLFYFDRYPWQNIFTVAIILVVLSIITSLTVNRFSHLRQYQKTCLLAGIIAIFALIYFQIRIPYPKANDVSSLLTNYSSQLINVQGKVLNEPRLTSNNRVKFWFEPDRVLKSLDRSVSGKLYITLPTQSDSNIYPGKILTIKGILYKPQTIKNPGGFDFKSYLNREGAFAGLKGLEIIDRNKQKEPNWGWWKIRHRIIKAQADGLGNSAGELVSSMVLGRKAVDLSPEIRDRFIKVGLAHILAASGFHVSLLLAVILKITNRFSTKFQFWLGLFSLIIYVGLTGLQPSVIRASLMGVSVLTGLLLERKIIPLGSLLVAATILLLFNPLWIWNLGFQLSFLATFGLITTVPAITKKLDFIPSTLATIIAVPLAASLWTLPLVCFVFNVIASYSILVNIITTPLVTIISLGGMISAIAAVILPVLGSAIASFLFYPTLLLINIVTFFTNLPGSSLTVGKIPLIILISIYGLLLLVWLSKWWQARWYLVLLFSLTLIILPIVYTHFNLVQVTILATKIEQIIVIQDKGKVILINSGQENTAKYTVLPFLKEQGINSLDYGIALDNSSSFSEGWSEIATNIDIKELVINPDLESTIKINFEQNKLLLNEQKIIANSTKIESIESQIPLLKLQIKDLTWLLIGNLEGEREINIEKYLQQNALNFIPKVLLFSGQKIKPVWLQKWQPKIAIASTNKLEESSQKLLQAKQTKFYVTEKDGAIIWKPKTGFKTFLDSYF